MSNGSKKTPAPPASPFNKTAQHDAKRAAILSQAARLFNSHGARTTTLKDIAKNLGLTKTSLYYYVKTKEELIYQCYMAALERHHKALDDCDQTYQSPMDRAAAFFRQHVNSLIAAREGKANHIAALLEIASLKGSHRAEVEAQYISMFKRLRQYIRDGVNSGSLRQCDATSATRAILGSMEWTFFWLHSIPPEQLPKVADRALDILAHGLYAKPGEFQAPGLELADTSDIGLQGFDREEQNRLKQEAFYKAGTWFFNKQGFDGTSLDEIAEHLNVSKGAFYYHIKNKEDLLFHCYSRSLDIIAAIHAEAAKTRETGLEKVDRTCRRIFFFQNSDHGPLIRYHSITSLPMARRKQILQRTETKNQHFGDFLREGMADGSVRPVNIDIAANLIGGAINASMDIHLWRRVDDVDAAAIDYFDIIYNGLLPRAKP